MRILKDIKPQSTFLRAEMLALLTYILMSFTSPLAQTNFIKHTENPILPRGAPLEWDNDETAFAYVLRVDSTYRMYYSGDGSPGGKAWRIGLATSLDGLSWKKNSNNPVLDFSSSGAFDNQNVFGPSVQFSGSLYEMWYLGNYNSLYNMRIGYASSPDGISWSKYSANPVLARGSAGTWEGLNVTNPVVIRSDTLYQMWYTGGANDIWQTGYATSIDGVNWTKHPNNPVLRRGEAGEWDRWGTVARSVIFEDGQYYMWYHGRSQSGVFRNIQIGLATSTDGINWTKYAGNPVLRQGGGNSWDKDNVWFPHVIKEGHRYRMWYSGRNDGPSEDRLGYAEDFSQAAHVDSIWVSAETVLAGSEAASIGAHIANPHNEELAARAVITSADGRFTTSVNLTDLGNSWRGLWAVPAEVHDYSVGIELTNISAGYVHNSFAWGLFAEFSAIANPNPLSHSFTQLANIDDGRDGEAHNVEVAGDGSILLANGPDGLRAYSYDGTSFVNTAHVNDGGMAMDMVEGSDGTIFLANGNDGLRAYDYNGNSFVNRAHVNDGGAVSLSLASDGTILLGIGGKGLQAYSYDGTAFTSVAQYYTGGPTGVPRDIAVAPDGTIFLGLGGYYAFSFDGTFFTLIWFGWGSGNGVAFGADGTVFLLQGDVGAYDGTTYSSITVFQDAEENVLWPYGLEAAAEDIIFVAGKSSSVNLGSIQALSYDDSSFSKTAFLGHFDARDIVAVSHDTIFVASGSAGLFAFKYSSHVATSVAHKPKEIPAQFELLQNYPNPFNPTTIISYSVRKAGSVELKIYNQLGHEVRTLVNSVQSIGLHQIIWDGKDNLGNRLSSGIYHYKLRADTFAKTRKMLLIQ